MVWLHHYIKVVTVYSTFVVDRAFPFYEKKRKEKKTIHLLERNTLFFSCCICARKLIGAMCFNFDQFG